MKNIILKKLINRGFSKILPSMVICRADDLFHVVQVLKNRYGQLEVWVVVWHPIFLESKASFDPKNLVSPIQGCVSPTGIVSKWSWDATVDASDEVERLLLGFFANFRKLDDIRAALKGREVLDYFRIALASTKVDDLEFEFDLESSAQYEVRGGMNDVETSRHISRSFLMDLLGPHGFKMAPCYDLVAIREQGEIVECVRLCLDEFATFASLICFPWSRVVWQADKRWRGTYYPFGFNELRVSDRPWISPVRMLECENKEAVRDVVIQRLAELRVIDTAEKFALSLGASEEILRTAILRIVSVH